MVTLEPWGLSRSAAASSRTHRSYRVPCPRSSRRNEQPRRGVWSSSSWPCVVGRRRRYDRGLRSQHLSYRTQLVVERRSSARVVGFITHHHHRSAHRRREEWCFISREEGHHPRRGEEATAAALAEEVAILRAKYNIGHQCSQRVTVTVLNPNNERS